MCGVTLVVRAPQHARALMCARGRVCLFWGGGGGGGPAGVTACQKAAKMSINAQEYSCLESPCAGAQLCHGQGEGQPGLHSLPRWNQVAGHQAHLRGGQLLHPSAAHGQGVLLMSQGRPPRFVMWRFSRISFARIASPSSGWLVSELQLCRFCSSTIHTCM